MGNCILKPNKHRGNDVTQLFLALMAVNQIVYDNRQRGVFDLSTEKESQKLQIQIAGWAHPIPDDILPEGYVV